MKYRCHQILKLEVGEQEKVYQRGDEIPADVFESLPLANRRALLSTNAISMEFFDHE